MKLLFEKVAKDPDVVTKNQMDEYYKYLDNRRLYDEAEILVTFYTFAPLADERIPVEVKQRILQGILKTNDPIKGSIKLKIERQLASPRGYMDWLRKYEIQQHPIRYIREEAKDKETLEGPTHVDAQIVTDNLLILIEVKFTADIQCDTTYALHRNQLARTIDVGIEEAKGSGKKLIVLLCTPKVYMERKSRLYYYKIQEYSDPVNIKNDIQWRPVEVFKDVVVKWVSLEEVIKIIYSHAEFYLTPEEMQELTSFFSDRMLR